MANVGFFEINACEGRAAEFARRCQAFRDMDVVLFHFDGGETVYRWRDGWQAITEERPALDVIFIHKQDKDELLGIWPQPSAKIVVFSTTALPEALEGNEIHFTQAWPEEVCPLTEVYLHQAIDWAKNDGPPPSLIKPDQDLHSALHLLCQGYLAIVAGDHAERKAKVQAQDWWEIIKDAPLPSTASDEENTLLTAIRDRQQINQEMVAAACRALDQSAA